MVSFEYDVFLSHNSKDKPAVRKLAGRLRDDGLRVWFDEWVIKPGGDIFLAIENGLEVSRVLVLVMSPNGFGSDWVDLERNMVLFRDPKNRDRRFVPLLLAECKIPDVLKRYMHIDYRDGTESAYQQLVEACRPVSPHVSSGPAPADRKIDTSHLPTGSTPLVGRQGHLANLTTWQVDPNVVIASLIAAGGVGKSALLEGWLTESRPEYGGATKIFGWSFYSQGTHETQTSSGPFFSAALPFFGHVGNLPATEKEKASRLVKLLQQHPFLLILDGMEPLQHPKEIQGGNFKDVGIYRLLRLLSSGGLDTNSRNSLIILTSRQPINELASWRGVRYQETLLDSLTEADGTQLLKSLGVKRGLPAEFNATVREMKGHALGLVLLGSLLASRYEGDIARRDQIGALFDEGKHGEHAKRVMAHYDDTVWIDKASHRVFLRLLGLFDRPIEGAVFVVLCWFSGNVDKWPSRIR